MSDQNSIHDVEDAMRREGFMVEQVVADGRVHRFNRDANDHKKSAWYCCFQNTSNKGELFYVCTFNDWRDGTDEYKFISAFSQTKYDKKVVEDQIRAAKKKRDQEQERVWEEAHVHCRVQWETFSEVGDSEYLVKKGISDSFGCRFAKDVFGTSLFVPVRDNEAKLWGWQKIQSTGVKYFYPGTKKKGCYHLIGETDGASILYLAEGFATAASIHMATLKPVAVAFDAGNLVNAALSLRLKFPDLSIVVCGDDDRWKEKNAGREKAEEAAKRILGQAVFPVFKDLNGQPTDFNDLHLTEGLKAVSEILDQPEPEKNYVRALGYSGDTYFYTSSQNPQISRLLSHDTVSLLKLMSLEYWESLYPGKTGTDWTKGKSDLMNQARRRGFFQEKNIRGIGVWEDQGRTVINLGDRIFYQGFERHPHAIKTDYFYTVGPKVNSISKKRLTTEECQPILDLVKLLSLGHDQQRIFLGGWAVISVISGVLKWRPHLWLTGEAGSGKSTVMNQFISKLQCGLVRRVSKNTTEAGIRQLVRHDAVPLIYDEFETKSKRTMETVEACLEFICQSSTDDSGDVVKGSSDGTSMSFTPRFCALVSSVRPVKLASEEQSRFVFVEFEKNSSHWPEVRKLLDTFTDDYCQKFMARTISLIPVLRANQALFEEALAARFDRRIAQQYGVLLAGWVLLTTSERIDSEAVAGFLEGLQLDLSPVADQENCLDFLMKKKIRTEAGSEFRLEDLVRQAQFEDGARKVLALYGLGLVESRDGGNYLFICKEHPELRALFYRSSWVGSWYHSLCRIPGAIRDADARLYGGRKVGGVKIPYAALL